MVSYPKSLLSLIEGLKKLPGVGRKTAERFAFKILDWPQKDVSFLATTLNQMLDSIKKCQQCGCLQEGVSCSFCCKQNLEPILCVVAYAKDVYPIEHTRLYQGHYHVLGCLISPLEGKTAADLDMDLLLSRLDTLGIAEVILALDSTLSGDTTSLYIQERLKGRKIKITKLASGVPLGSSLDFIDEGTLSQAFHGRQMIWQEKI